MVHQGSWICGRLGHTHIQLRSWVWVTLCCKALIYLVAFSLNHNIGLCICLGLNMVLNIESFSIVTNPSGMWQMPRWQFSSLCFFSFCHQHHQCSVAGHLLYLVQVGDNLLPQKLWIIKWCACYWHMTYCHWFCLSLGIPMLALLTWKVAQRKMPWNIVLLLGGGFALAKGSEVIFNHILFPPAT